MNSSIISLSSNCISSTIYNNTVYLSEPTSVGFNLSGICLNIPPLYVTFRWGDGSDDKIVYNNFFLDDYNVDVVKEMIYGSDYSVIDTYNHTYTPAQGSLTTLLTCQIAVTYYNSTSSKFIQPIHITSPSYYTSIEDIELVASNIIDSNGSMLFSFATKHDGSIIEAAVIS